MKNLDREQLTRVRNSRSLRNLAGKGCLVCSVHLGPYHMVGRALTGRGLSIQVFSGPAFIQRLRETWQRLARQTRTPFEVLSPEKPRDTVRAIKHLRDGGVLILYTDTTNQSGKTQNPDHYSEVELMNMAMNLRNGAAQLSYKAGVPMIYAITWRAWWGGRMLKFSDPYPPVGSQQEIGDRMRSMYSWFDREMQKRPAQWDGWGETRAALERAR